MKKQILAIKAVLLFSLFVGFAPAMAQQVTQEAIDNCNRMKKASTDARDKLRADNLAREREFAKRTQEASSCLARAGDNILRAAIPPSLGSILGVFADPGGYITNATSNAACNVVTNEANGVARGAADINGQIRKTSSDAQGVFTGEVDKGLGGKGASSGYYNNTPPPTPDSGFFQTMTCRLFGRC